MRESETIFPAELRSPVEKNMVAASRLAAANFRLDAPGFLSQDEFSEFMPGTSKSLPLSQMADVFTVYIQSPILAYVRPFANSRPYMTTSELAENQTGRTTHVSMLADPRLLDWQIKHRNIVVSRSGRVGEAYWVDKKLDGALVGDSFRVAPKSNGDGPFIFAVLASTFARNFLSGSAYGSVVDHASLDQLRNFPVPEVNPSVKSKITASMGKALASRERAYDLLDQAQALLLRANKLEPIDVANIASNSADVANFSVSSAELADSETNDCEFRLEAHFHNPISQSVIAKIRKSPSKKLTIGELTHDVIMGARFKRNYVESEYGTPFLSGKSIVQINQSDLKYLSNSETDDLSDMLVKRGWILVTCSGTIGRTCFVWHNFENYAASQHILRVLPNDDEVDSGYLYAFLSSDYGFHQTIRFRHGSVIDEITDNQLKKVIVPVPSPTQQKEIGDLVRLAYEKRAEALRLENETQDVLLRGIKGNLPKEK